jgi:hypothetical protein
LDAEEIVTLVADTAGLLLQQVKAALAYWAEYSDEIDELLHRARTEALQARLRWQREQELLGR